MHRRNGLFAASVLLVGGLFAAAQEAPFKSDKPPIPGVEVELRISIATLDPLKPEKGHVEVIVRNKSKKAVEAPMVYTGGFQKPSILIWAADEWPLSLRLWAGEKEQRLQKLNPNEEVVVFKSELTEFLLLDHVEPRPLKAKEPRYVWSWYA